MASDCAASSLSSTTRMRVGAGDDVGAIAAGGAGTAAAASTIGKVTVKREPRPMPSLSTAIVPPWSSTRFLAIARPRPRPPLARCSACSPWTKRSKMRGASSAVMPTPSSSTRRTALSPSRPSSIAIRCSARENLTALVIRLQTTWVSRTASPWTQTGVSGPFTSGCRRRPRSTGSVSSSARVITSRRSTRSRRSTTFPDAMRETSSRSSTMRERCATWRSMMPRSRALAGPSRRAMTSSEVTIGASGLRSSWPSIATNSSLARFATSASRSASRDSPNRRTLSSASAARCASSTTSAPSASLKRRPDSACNAHIAPIVRPRVTSGTTHTARTLKSRANAPKVLSGVGVELGRLDVGEEGPAGRDRPRERAGRRQRRLIAHERAQRRLARRVDMVGQLGLQHAVLVEQVDAADVGDVRHDHRADRRQRRLLLERLVERAREQRACADELLQASLRFLGARARIALGVEQPLALGLVLLAQRRGGDERVRDRLDLDHVGVGAAHRLVAAERQRGVAQARDRLRDAARDAPRGDAADAEREQDAAAVGERRIAQRARLDGRRDAEGDGPAGRLNARDGGVDEVPFDRRRLADHLVALADAHQGEQRRRGRAADVAIVLARARDADVVGIEYRDDPVRRHALLVDDAQDRLGPDDRCEHVTDIAVAHDRDAHRNAEVAERAALERADDRFLDADDLGEALRLGDRRLRRAELARGAEQRRAVGCGEQDLAPLGARREDAAREPVRAREIDGAGGADRFGQRERFQRRHREPQLGVDRGGERAREVERRLLGLPALLLEQRLQRDAGHQRQRQDRHRGKQEETAAKRDRMRRQAPISGRRRVARRGLDPGSDLHRRILTALPLAGPRRGRPAGRGG